jgi:mutator protein MutT
MKNNGGKTMKEVTAAIIIKSGKILICQRSKTDNLSGKWEFPGGKLELGENFEQYIEREVLEETECKVKAVKQIKAITSYSPGSEFEKEVVLVFYLCKYIDGEPKQGDGVNSAEWIDETKFSRLSVSEVIPPQIFDVVSQLCAKKSFPDISFDFIGPSSTAKECSSRQVPT